ncbi:MAG: hypothetical protein O2794_03715 [bacterium]|nr:hypothetical protein [bacterium]
MLSKREVYIVIGTLSFVFILFALAQQGVTLPHWAVIFLVIIFATIGGSYGIDRKLKTAFYAQEIHKVQPLTFWQKYKLSFKAAVGYRVQDLDLRRIVWYIFFLVILVIVMFTFYPSS